jgi:methylenetetrahydrofolate dehydrogenase (NADP+)/methenyltetrahydrofolate cyclohydrolase
VGRSLALLLLRDKKAPTVTICHTATADLAAHTRRADFLVVAAGRPGLVTGDMVKEGAVVIDVGTNVVASPDGTDTLVGDVDFASVAPRASAITPVPGGVGPVTAALLLRNVVICARQLLLE